MTEPIKSSNRLLYFDPNKTNECTVNTVAANLEKALNQIKEQIRAFMDTQFKQSDANNFSMRKFKRQKVTLEQNDNTKENNNNFGCITRGKTQESFYELISQCATVETMIDVLRCFSNMKEATVKQCHPTTSSNTSQSKSDPSNVESGSTSTTSNNESQDTSNSKVHDSYPDHDLVIVSKDQNNKETVHCIEISDTSENGSDVKMKKDLTTLYNTYKIYNQKTNHNKQYSYYLGCSTEAKDYLKRNTKSTTYDISKEIQCNIQDAKINNNSCTCLLQVTSFKV